MIEYRFRVPNAAVFTLYSYSKTLEYRLEYATADSLICHCLWFVTALSSISFPCTHWMHSNSPSLLQPRKIWFLDCEFPNFVNLSHMWLLRLFFHRLTQPRPKIEIPGQSFHRQLYAILLDPEALLRIHDEKPKIHTGIRRRAMDDNQ
jgi:hypothetical protein